MDSRKIFDAIDACDDVFIKEVIQDIESRRKKQKRLRRLFFNKNQHLSGIRIAAAIVLFIVVLGVGVKTTAHISTLFHDWMENVFTKNDVIQIIPDSTTVDMGNAKISLKNHVQMTGQNETFLYETSYDGIEEKVEKVFSIEGRKQKELSKKKFEGHYQHLDISFEYSTIDNEIFAYNMHGAVEEVFPVIQQDTVYAVLETSAKEYTQESGQNGKRLIAINLKTDEIQSELASKTGIDFVMAPNGKYVLVRYNLIQPGGSVKRKWTSFNLQTKEEMNLGDIDIFDPKTNIKIGCWYLNKLYKEFGRLDLVIAAYNGGSGNVNKWLSDYSYSKDGKSLDLIPFEETSMYVKKVTKNYKMYNKLYSKEG